MDFDSYEDIGDTSDIHSDLKWCIIFNLGKSLFFIKFKKKIFTGNAHS